MSSTTPVENFRYFMLKYGIIATGPLGVLYGNIIQKHIVKKHPLSISTQILLFECNARDSNIYIMPAIMFL